MSIQFLKGTTEVLILHPKEFRRIYEYIWDSENDRADLKYSHSDLIVETESGAAVMIGIIQHLLSDGEYSVKMLPTDLTFKIQHRQRGDESMDKLKKLVFMNFANLKVSDYYCDQKLQLPFD